MPNSAGHHKSARTLRLGRGFTLIELLVVVFIIVLLISILVVGLNAAVRVARQQVDRTTARNLGVAATSFENSFGWCTTGRSTRRYPGAWAPHAARSSAGAAAH